MRIPLAIPSADAHPFDVVGFGLNSIDLVAVVAEYPTVNSKQRLQRVARLPGGQMATAVATCARLGWRARYIGRFGGDDLGAMSRDSLARDGVDLSAAQTMSGITNQFAVILVDARTGERTVLWDRHPALNMEPGDVEREAVTSGRLLIVDCHQTAAAAQAARLARAAAIPTIIDVEKVRPGIGDLLQNIDVIIAAEEFPTALTGHEHLGEAISLIAREWSASLVCVTLGAEGSLAWCRGREIRTPAFPIDCVDSTGAGDCFRGAFAAACLRMPNGDVEDVLSYANAVAALNCRALGSRGGLPTPDEVEQLMIARFHI
ncbi:MAG TPA: PfkB family carbohydrate kinase [Vicinamibacterales bacterium]|nr:PfkB family carbohydrate kinase [Vicinamibacterales bacterium]